MIHSKVDIDRWQHMFPLENLRREAREFVETRRKESPDVYKSAADIERHVKLLSPSGENITSPFHIAVVEQLRAEFLESRCPVMTPTDVFVFARGEPVNRCVTKIGGLPFRSRTKNWPLGRTNTPMTFLAQFCFVDSTDLCGSLPGEILLVFADGAYGADWRTRDKSALRFEWVDRSESNLIEAGEMPQTRWNLFPVYGEIHRTKDYLIGDKWDIAWWRILFKQSKSLRNLVDGLRVKNALMKNYHQPWCIQVIEGTKIGGVPRWVQRAEPMPGRFLCTLGSFQPAHQISQNKLFCRPYPFTNCEEPCVRERRAFRIGEELVPTNSLLMWGDAGSLYLFLDEAGQVHWTIQCY